MSTSRLSRTQITARATAQLPVYRCPENQDNDLKGCWTHGQRTSGPHTDESKYSPDAKHPPPLRGLNNAGPEPAKLLAEFGPHLCSNCAAASTPDLPMSQYRRPQLFLERPNHPARRDSPGLALTPFTLGAYSDNPVHHPCNPLHTQPTQARWRTCAAAQLD